MTPRRAWASVAALIVLGAVWVHAGSRDVPGRDEAARCRELGGGSLDAGRLRLRVGGRIPSCGDSGNATRAFVRVARLLERLPPELDPGEVQIELSPRFAGVRARPERGLLLVSQRHADAPDGVWLHEIAHLAAHGPRPREPASARLALAIDEGVADYAAAALGGQARLAPGSEHARDLEAPPRMRPEEWARLAFPGFDAHRFGWVLAAAFWRAEPRAGELLQDLVSCLAGGALADHESPAAVLDAMARRCPARSRARIARAVESWAPDELRRTR